MKISIDKDTEILLQPSSDGEKVVFSTKIKGQDSKIFLTSLELDIKQVDLLVSQLVKLRASLKEYV